MKGGLTKNGGGVRQNLVVQEEWSAHIAFKLEFVGGDADGITFAIVHDAARAIATKWARIVVFMVFLFSTTVNSINDSG